jgi:hypothetical protein
MSAITPREARAIAPVCEGCYFSWQTFDLYTYLAPYIGNQQADECATGQARFHAMLLQPRRRRVGDEAADAR